MIHLALSNQALPIYGDGSQQRDYVFVDDTAAALIQLGDNAAADRRAFNVGSGTGTSLADMARTIIGAVGGGRIEHVVWPRLAEQIETGDFVADVTRIRNEIGWAPQTSFTDGIEQTVAFQRLHQVL
jgi:nucleoside-diphosphate-sugar epimerase